MVQLLGSTIRRWWYALWAHLLRGTRKRLVRDAVPLSPDARTTVECSESLDRHGGLVGAIKFKTWVAIVDFVWSRFYAVAPFPRSRCVKLNDQL
jgi:hypothetical protein